MKLSCDYGGQSGPAGKGGGRTPRERSLLNVLRSDLGLMSLFKGGRSFNEATSNYASLFLPILYFNYPAIEML